MLLAESVEVTLELFHLHGAGLLLLLQLVNVAKHGVQLVPGRGQHRN